MVFNLNLFFISLIFLLNFCSSHSLQVKILIHGVNIFIKLFVCLQVFKLDLKCSCYCRNPNLAKCGSEAQHLEKLGIWSPPGLPNV
jgi:hypothetical protein